MFVYPPHIIPEREIEIASHMNKVLSAGDDQLSIKLNTYVSAKVESVKDVLSEKWGNLGKNAFLFFSLSTFDFVLFLFVFCD